MTRQQQAQRYDAALQMFVEAPREPDMKRLAFIRWLVAGQRLEHDPAGPSTGEFATAERSN